MTRPLNRRSAPYGKSRQPGWTNPAVLADPRRGMGLAEQDVCRYLVVVKVPSPLMVPAANLDDAWRAAEDYGERHGHERVVILDLEAGIILPRGAS